MTMMSESEYEGRMDQLVSARRRRDLDVEAAQVTFTNELIEAYESGLTIYDINHATGLSVTTIRSRFKQRGVQMRRP